MVPGPKPPARGDAASFDEEIPTRRASSVFAAYARESEALIARNASPDTAQSLFETVRPPPPGAAPPRAAEVSLERVPQLKMTPEDLVWFSLDAPSEAILGAIDGKSSLRAVLARAGVSERDGVQVICALADQGVIVLG